MPKVRSRPAPAIIGPVAAYAALAACGGPVSAPATAESEPYLAEHSYGSESVAPAEPKPGHTLASEPTSAQLAARQQVDVYLNGTLLSESELAELAVVLGARPQPGEFWYDPRSGLWGMIGHGASGVTVPDLPAPPLTADVSRGGSRVRVNERLVTQAELRTMIRLLGGDEGGAAAYIGQYTLDAGGKLYRAGGAYLGNLARAAARFRASGASEPEPCPWLSLGKPDSVLGHATQSACD